jgi:carboxyl-terminal processing protease
MKPFRALVLLLVVACGFVGGGILPTQAATASAASMSAPLAIEEAGVQGRALAEAYNLLLDHYVQPLDTSALLRAGWDNLAKEADGKAAAPGNPPTFVGDRAADLEIARTALRAYLDTPGSSPEGFIAAHAMIRGMIRYVDEGHTYFLDPQQYRDYQAWSRGDNTYVGIGISVSTKGAAPRIVEVYDGTPAMNAGLRSGDVLVRINNQSVGGLALDEMTSLVRGPAGTQVQIVVRRGDDPQEVTFSIQRTEIHLQFVRDRLVEDDIGYLLLRGFPEPSVVDSIEQDVAKFQAEGVHGLVLDLRGNSGGRIDVGTRLLGHFLPNGSTVYQEVDRGGQNSMHSTRGGGQYEMPLVVLVDGGTASMGEIFASAVQQHGAATIVGTSTAGSVAAAQVFGLPDGSALQVTVFDILSADGKPLNKVGVVPDEVVQPNAGDIGTSTDPVLNRAIEILHDQIAGGTTGHVLAAD